MSATQLDRIEALMRKLIAQTAPKIPSGDEKVFKDPSEKYWAGESFKGCKLSECSAAFLRAYAKYKSACAFMGRKDNEPEKLKYVERDEVTAKLAIAWAEYREASGEQEAASEPGVVSSTAEDSADVPF